MRNLFESQGYLTVREWAKREGMNLNTAKDYVQKGRIPHSRFCGHLYIFAGTTKDHIYKSREQRKEFREWSQKIRQQMQKSIGIT